jgi:hypothetical protein
MNPKEYQNKQLGFDRTQLFKEYESPIIRRGVALAAAQDFYSNNNIEYTPLELKSLVIGILSFLEEGDMQIFNKLQEYLDKKQAKEELLLS